MGEGGPLDVPGSEDHTGRPGECLGVLTCLRASWGARGVLADFGAERGRSSGGAWDGVRVVRSQGSEQTRKPRIYTLNVKVWHPSPPDHRERTRWPSARITPEPGPMLLPLRYGSQAKASAVS